EVEQMRAWRDAGMSMSEIGQRLGRSANAVISKARKLEMARIVPPPPPRQGRPRLPEVPRAGRSTLPQLDSLKDEPC
ncbi:MAG TPA: hypothetical protein VGH84_02760, partial [Steroidobacteraceae bacterium]